MNNIKKEMRDLIDGILNAFNLMKEEIKPDVYIHFIMNNIEGIIKFMNLVDRVRYICKANKEKEQMTEEQRDKLKEDKDFLEKLEIYIIDFPELSDGIINLYKKKRDKKNVK